MKLNVLLSTLFVSLFCIAGTCYGQADTELIIASLEKYLAEKHIPGAMVSIVRSDTVLFSGGIGLANLETNESVSENHLFRLGSVSKSFTALGILHLCDELNLPLDTPLSDLSDELIFQNSWSEDYPVTIEHMLEHTAGFDDFHLHAIYNTLDAEEPPVSIMTAAHRNSLKTRWRPGLKKAYSNPGYILAGQVIESLSDQRYAAYIRENILKPLKLTESGFYFDRPEGIPFAQGYQYLGGRHITVPFMHIQGGPAGGFCSNAREMSSFLQFMLNRGALGADSLFFDKKLFDRIENARTNIAAKNGLPYGYGLGNYSIWKNGHLFHGHSGGIDGFSSRYVYSRAADIGVSVAINRQGNANAVVDEILTLVIGDGDGRGPERIIYDIPDTLVAKYKGFYEFRCSRNELFSFTDAMLAGLILDFEDDHVITRSILGKARDTLYYAGDNKFYQNDEGIPSTIFFEGSGNKPAFWINESYTEMASRPMRLVKFFGLLTSLLIFISFQLYFIIVVIRYLFSKKGSVKINGLYVFLTGLSFLLMMGTFAVTMNDLTVGGQKNLNAILFYGSSVLMCLFTAVALVKLRKINISGFGKYYLIAATLSALVVSWYFWDIGFVGLKLWSY